MGKQYWVIKTHKFKTMFNIQMSECKVKILLNNRWKIWHPTRIFFTSKVGTYLPTIHTANVMYFLSRAKSYCEKGFDRNTQSVGRAFYHRSHWFLWCLSSQQLCVLQAPNVSLLDYFLERHRYVVHLKVFDVPPWACPYWIIDLEVKVNLCTKS